MLIAFNKPFGVLSQFTPDGSPNRTLAEFGFPKGVYPIGRLDGDSEGLLLLSDEAALNDWWQLQFGAAAPVQRVAVGSSLKFRLLARGLADVYPRFGPTMEWDTAAGDAVLRGARWLRQIPAPAPRFLAAGPSASDRAGHDMSDRHA